MKDRCLIITGTIVPNAILTKHADPKIRRQEYLELLAFYSEHMDDPIYFLENSSYDFSIDRDFKKLFREKKIKLVKFPISCEVQCGKGFQEFEMIEKFIQSLSGQYRSFIKISGRYQYFNIKELTDFRCEGIVIDIVRRHKLAITSIFYTTFHFYQKHLMDLYLDVDDSQGHWIEKILFRKLRSKNIRRNVQFFPVSPLLKVTTGSTGDSIDTNIDTIKNMIVNHTRNLERSILRRLFINELYI